MEDANSLGDIGGAKTVYPIDPVEAPNRTLSFVDVSHTKPQIYRESCLVIVLDGANPTSPSVRLSLSHTDQVIVGRGPKRRFARTTAQTQRQLQIDLNDPWLSSTHILIRHENNQWMIKDRKSKNGTHVNGTAISQTSLCDGDLIHIGATLLLFRQVCVRPEYYATDLEFDHGIPPCLATLNHRLQSTFDNLKTLASTTVPVLLQGETGTGKEQTAQAIHTISKRSGRFVAINCGAIPESLVESELFGCQRGAYSGAVEARVGHVRAANQGTLFLDEIADLSARAQVKLLRILQEKRVVPVGAHQPHPVDVRIIAATNRDLEQLVITNQFRNDLYARLAGAVFELPPLRQRQEDIGGIIATILKRICARDAAHVRFHRDAAYTLATDSWPRNIRQLFHTLETAVALAKNAEIHKQHLSIDHASSNPKPSRGAKVDTERRNHLVNLLQTHNGNISAVARTMKVARVQIRRWCTRYDIDINHFRHSEIPQEKPNLE